MAQSPVKSLPDLMEDMRQLLDKMQLLYVGKCQHFVLPFTNTLNFKSYLCNITTNQQWHFINLFFSCFVSIKHQTTRSADKELHLKPNTPGKKT